MDYNQDILYQKNNLQICDQQFQTCKICYMPYSPSQFSQFRCKHRTCQNCMQSWVSALFERQNLQEDNKITCPFLNCGIELQYQELKAEIKNEFLFNKIDDLFMKKCLRQSDDVAFCPMPQCQFAGILPKGACKQPLHCEKCNKEWRHSSNRSKCQQIMSLIRSPGSIFHSDTWSNLKKVVFTVACPKCGIFIEKNGGCQHIGCTKCRYEFCWFCQQSYAGYRHQNNEIFCAQRLMMLVSIYAMIGLVVDFKVAQHFPFIQWFQKKFIYWVLVLICSFFYGVIVIAPFLILNENFLLLRVRYRSYRRWSCKFGSGMCVLYLVLESFLISFLYLFNNFSRNVLWTMLYGVAGMIGGAIIILLLYALYRIFRSMIYYLCNLRLLGSIIIDKLKCKKSQEQSLKNTNYLAQIKCNQQDIKRRLNGNGRKKEGKILKKNPKNIRLKK